MRRLELIQRGSITHNCISGSVHCAWKCAFDMWVGGVTGMGRYQWDTYQWDTYYATASMGLHVIDYQYFRYSMYNTHEYQIPIYNTYRYLSIPQYLGIQYVFSIQYLDAGIR